MEGFSEQDIRALIIGVLGSIIVLIIAYGFKRIRKSYINGQVVDLESDKKFIEKVQHSIFNLNRIFFAATSLIFVFIGLANILPLLLSRLQLSINIVFFVEFILWLSVMALSFAMFRLFYILKDPKRSVAKIEAKILKLKVN